MQVSLYNTPQLNRSQLDGLEKLVLKNETVVCKLMRGILVRLFARVPPVNIIVCVNDTFKLESELENV